MNRAFTFSDPKVIEKLKREFVCYAGNTAELQPSFARLDYSGSDWFMKVAGQAQWKVQGNTTQGMYVAAADGTAYGWKNKPGISDTLRFLDKGLNEFKQHPPEKAEISKAEIEADYTLKPKPGTSIIAVYSRVCPVPEGLDNRNRNIGRDYMWVAREEVQELLAASNARQAADPPLRLPRSVLGRLCRFALVDAIRGEPDYWESSDIYRAQFTLERRPAEKGLQSFAFKGDFMFMALLSGRGIAGRIEGEFTVDELAEKIVKFRAYAPTKAFGSSVNTTRGTPRLEFPLVFAFVDANDDPLAQEVPPSALSRRADYRDPRFPKGK